MTKGHRASFYGFLIKLCHSFRRDANNGGIPNRKKFTLLSSIGYKNDPEDLFGRY